MRIAITGANGFIGKALCERLSRDGHSIAAISRKSEPPIFGTSYTLDITNPGSSEAILKLMQDSDVLIHTVGVTHEQANLNVEAADYFATINVRPTLELAKLSRAAGVKLFIFISSVKAVAEQTERSNFGVPQRLSCSNTPNPQDNYGRSKLRAEDEAERILENSATKLVIIRSPLVYGVGQKGNMKTLFDAISKRSFVLIPKIKNTRSLVSVDNMCSAISTIIRTPSARRGRFFISDAELSTSELLAKIATALEVKTYQLPIPTWSLKFFASIFRKSGEMKKLTASLLVDNKQFCESYNWSPEVTLENVLKRIAKEYRKI